MASDTGLAELRVQARRAMERAYAPYSEFRVGAAVETAEGKVHAGCNVENASFSVTMCAERVAIGAAVTAGGRSLRRVYVCSTSVEPVPPCGVCRQALAEFGPDLEVISEGSGGQMQRWTLGELLPDQFRLEEHVPADEDGRNPGAERRT
ncbi:MAG: cytidine deaminase [Gemmatimonadota bacterium]|nr:cytidine deaminase [Gemmatimonadota bacterium]MCK5482671.1 cytidine deaminase [Gemmatimonadota bacterium]MCK5490148.1 cytidine deaminase [Gemmatimonadota bacterium]